MEKESIPGKMEENIKVIILMIKNMVLVNIFGLMVASTKGNGD